MAFSLVPLWQFRPYVLPYLYLGVGQPKLPSAEAAVCTASRHKFTYMYLLTYLVTRIAVCRRLSGVTLIIWSFILTGRMTPFVIMDCLILSTTFIITRRNTSSLWSVSGHCSVVVIVVVSHLVTVLSVLYCYLSFSYFVIWSLPPSKILRFFYISDICSEQEAVSYVG